MCGSIRPKRDRKRESNPKVQTDGEGWAIHMWLNEAKRGYKEGKQFFFKIAKAKTLNPRPLMWKSAYTSTRTCEFFHKYLDVIRVNYWLLWRATYCSWFIKLWNAKCLYMVLFHKDFIWLVQGALMTVEYLQLSVNVLFW